MATELKNLSIRRVALVDRGANPDAFVEIFKRENMEDKDTPTVEDLTQKLEKLTAAQEELVKRAETAEAKVKELEQKEEKPDPIAKADPEVRKMIEDAQKEASEAKQRIAKLEDQRDKEMFITKASVLKHIGTADDLAEDLRDISRALGKERFEKFEAVLQAVEKRLATSKLFSELGSDQGAGDAESKLENLAKRYATENKVSVAKARIEVSRTPEAQALYAQYQAERK